MIGPLALILFGAAAMLAFGLTFLFGFGLGTSLRMLGRGRPIGDNLALTPISRR